MKKGRSKILNLKNYKWKRLCLELIVVFLGVTSGFLLNNWRIQKQDKQTEQKYISRFLQDINYNIAELESAIKSDSIWITQTNPLLLSLKHGSIKADSAKVAIEQIINISKIEVHSGTYEDIINSGNLNIISDFNLKTLIVDYNIVLQKTVSFEDFIYKYFNDLVLPFVFSEYSILSQEFKNPGIINSVRFSNVITLYYFFIQKRKDVYDELLIKSYSLRDEMHETLTSRK
jgi:hypothetical protein